MKTDTDYVQEMDITWLLANDWTVRANIAYRKILDSDRSTERIEQICMQYELNGIERSRVIKALQDLVSLKRLLS